MMAMIATTASISTRREATLCRPGGWSELLHLDPPMSNVCTEPKLGTLTYSIITAYVSSPSLGCGAPALSTLRKVTARLTRPDRCAGSRTVTSRPRGDPVAQDELALVQADDLDGEGRPSPSPPGLVVKNGRGPPRASRGRPGPSSRDGHHDRLAFPARTRPSTCPCGPPASSALRTRFSKARSSSSSSPDECRLRSLAPRAIRRPRGSATLARDDAAQSRRQVERARA